MATQVQGCNSAGHSLCDLPPGLKLKAKQKTQIHLFMCRRIDAMRTPQRKKYLKNRLPSIKLKRQWFRVLNGLMSVDFLVELRSMPSATTTRRLVLSQRQHTQAVGTRLSATALWLRARAE